jgi:hypothetical protein
MEKDKNNKDIFKDINENLDMFLWQGPKKYVRFIRFDDGVKSEEI